jgi:hypothetical protein
MLGRFEAIQVNRSMILKMVLLKYEARMCTVLFWNIHVSVPAFKTIMNCLDQLSSCELLAKDSVP